MLITAPPLLPAKAEPEYKAMSPEVAPIVVPLENRRIPLVPVAAFPERITTGPVAVEAVPEETAIDPPRTAPKPDSIVMLPTVPEGLAPPATRVVPPEVLPLPATTETLPPVACTDWPP